MASMDDSTNSVNTPAGGTATRLERDPPGDETNDFSILDFCAQLEDYTPTVSV